MASTGSRNQIEGAGGDAGANGDANGGSTPVETGFNQLKALRGALEAANVELSETLRTEGPEAAATFECLHVDPAFDSMLMQEERILRARSRTMRDLAIKIVIAADNDFSSDVLNALLAAEAREIAAAA